MVVLIVVSGIMILVVRFNQRAAESVTDSNLVVMVAFELVRVLALVLYDFLLAPFITQL